MQSANDDDEAFEPHSGVYTHADEIHDVNSAPAPAEPEELRRRRVAKEHSDPPIPPVGTQHTVPERDALILIAAVRRDETGHRVGVENDRHRERPHLSA